MNSVSEQFAAAVSRFPDRLAVSLRREDGADRFTYRQLDAMARAAASGLFARGVRAGDRCAILAENGPRWCAVYLGILRLGAIAVPLDTAYTTTQVGTLLHDCGARALVASRTFQDVGAGAAAGGACVVVPLHEAASEPHIDAPVPPCPSARSDPAVILYTSGATADPKGVVLTHENLLAERDAALAVVNVDEHDATLAVLPLFHVLAQMSNLLLPLTVGAHVVFLETFTTREVLRALDEEGITVFCSVPQFFYLIHKRIVGEIARRGFLGRKWVGVLLGANRAFRRVGLNLGPWIFPRVHRLLGRRMRLIIAGGSAFDRSIAGDLHDLGFSILQVDGLTESSGAGTITRGADVIVLGSGTHVYPEEIEAHYQRSLFIRELCVLGLPERGDPLAERLHAIVVPDVEVLRERRIVNVVELIRYELEGLSVSLPVDTRVLRFDVTFEPLARTPTGALKRHEILKRYRAAGSSSPDASPASADLAGVVASPVASAAEPHVQRLIESIQSIVRPGVVVRADSNLELDLGLDSMERVELLASLEHRFDVRLAQSVADSAFVVRDLAEAFGQTRERPPAEVPRHASWASLLQNIEPDATLKALLKPRRLYVLVLFCVASVIVRVLARPRIEGVDRLPLDGPFIICPNHQSYLDPFLVMGVLPFRVFRRLFFVGAAEYFQSRLTRWLAARLNIVSVDPDANLLSAMRAGAFGLRHGKVLMLFPEGERSIDGGVKTFRKGAAILSQQLGVPIVPVAIDGMFEIWPRTRPLHWRKLLPWSGHRTMLCVGDPLPPSEAVAAQTARLRDHVERMWLGFETLDRGRAT